MTHEREIRTFSTSLRAATRNGKRTLTGRAAAFGTLSHELGDADGVVRFREIIKPGCFTNALRRGDETIFTFNHIPSTIMARTRNGSLRLQQSARGLDFEADLPDTTMADDMYKLVSAGLVTECSFAFMVDKDSWLKQSEAKAMFSQIDFAGISATLPIRLLEDVTLRDCAAVCDPAYPSGTKVGVDISSVDPAATRPHMEGASIPESVLVEARSRGGNSRLLSEDEAQLVRVKAKALVIRLDDAEGK